MTYTPWRTIYPKAIAWDTDIKVDRVDQLMSQTAATYPDNPAFDFLGKRLKWKEIDEAVNAMACGLQNIHVKKGTRVALLLPNCPQYLIAYYAILRTGGVVVNCNPLYPLKELKYLIDDSGAEILITADLSLMFDNAFALLKQSNLKYLIVSDFADWLPTPKKQLFKLVKRKEISDIPQHNKVLRWDEIQGSTPPVLPDIDPQNDLAVIQYTGGTTGTPKGAMLTHANVYANTEQARLWFNLSTPGTERMMGIIPFFHVFAMTAVMNFSVRQGFEIIALPRFELMQTLKTVHKRKPHYMPAVPAIYNAINNCPRRKKYDLSSLLYCISGGAPLPVEVKKNFEGMTGCTVIEGYGLSETSPVVCANPIDGENRAGSIGLPFPGTMVELRDLDDPALIITEPRKRGELCVRGPQVMKGYWNRPEENEKVFIDGALRTGDVAEFDEDGYAYIVDRIKDMIITNGYNVYPRNVEEAIYLHPAIEECIVAGLPDTNRGEIVKAWVKLKPNGNLDITTLKEFLADHLSPMEIPKRIEFRDQPLPKTMIGKLSRKDVLAEEK